MSRLDKWRVSYERVLEWLVIVLMVVLATEVSLGIFKSGLEQLAERLTAPEISHAH